MASSFSIQLLIPSVTLHEPKKKVEGQITAGEYECAVNFSIPRVKIIDHHYVVLSFIIYI